MLFTNAATQKDSRKLDPSDIYFQAYLTIRDAKKLEESGKFNDARHKYEQASKYHNIITRYHPNWKPNMVANRIKLTKAAIKAIEPKAVNELSKRNKNTQNFLENSASTTAKRPATGIKNQIRTSQKKEDSSTTRIFHKQQRQLNKLQLDNQRLRKELTKAEKSTNNSQEQQRLISIISAKNSEIANIRNILARAPLQADMDKLEHQNRTLKTEINITALSLKNTITQLKKTKLEAQKHKNNTALAERKAEEAKKQMKVLQKNMNDQKAVDNRIVNALRRELKELNSILLNTRAQLGKANAQITQMQLTLKQSQATINELTKERNALRTERDTLAEVLKQNNSDSVRKLIAESMRLGTELKEKNGRLEYLTKKNGVTENELLEAKRDLAVAKNRIIRYQQERTRHSKHILSLESQLRDAEAELTTAIQQPDKSISKKETEVLKATVKRLIKAQERRKLAENVLWETYKTSKTTIPGIVKAFTDLSRTKVTLSEEEKGLIAIRKPDSEFSSPTRVSPEHAKLHSTALQKDIQTYNNLVKRLFIKNHFEAARQILAEMDDRYPGHFPTLCNRGVLEIKTGNSIKAIEIFKEAITMRENSSYAHYMLGLSHFKNNELDASRNEFQQALDLKPGDARCHFQLGTLAGMGKRYKQAETHLKEAIKLDPTMAEAYFNLSFLYLQQKRKTDAIEAYKKALQSGAQPDPIHEQQLGL